MTINPFGRWAIRQTLGRRRGGAILHLLDNVNDEDVASLLRLLVVIRRRGVDAIVSDLAILDQLDRLFGNDNEQQTNRD